MSADQTSTRLVPIWTDPKTAIHLERIAYDVDDELDKALLLQIAEQIHAAPADPAEAVRIAISAEWMNTGMGNEERIDEVYDREGAAIYRTRAVLACLGCALPRNEDHA